MAGNLPQFKAGLDKWLVEVVADTARTVRQVAFAIDRELVRRTPVGNPELWAANRGKRRGDPGFVGKNYTGGRARANWIPSLEVPSNATVDQPDPTGAGAITKMGQVTSKYRLGQKIWLVNNLPYIRRLAYEHHSKQAPPGWVEASIQVGTKTVLKR
jgi:hypothetical protein